MFNQYAFHWALGFLAIYLIAQFAVSKHPYFQNFSQIQKSITVKLIALIGFTVIYGFVHYFVL